MFLVLHLIPQYQNGAIQIVPGQTSYAQFLDCPPASNLSECVERRSFWRWLSRIFVSVDGIVGAFFNMLATALNSGGGEGSAQTADPTAIWLLLNTSSVDYGTPNAPNYNGGSIVTTLDPGWQIDVSIPVYHPDYPDCAGILGGSAFLDDCNNCVGGTTGIIPCYVPTDCAGVPNGTAYVDSCNTCVGGTTGLLPCIQDCAGVWGGTAGYDGCNTCAGGTSGIIRCDTIKPLIVICDSIAIANGKRLTDVLDGTSSVSSYIQQIRDSSLLSLNEAGISITEIFLRRSVFGVFNFQVGNDNSVEILTSDSIQKIIAGLHTHPKGKANTPSAQDLYHLIEGNIGNNEYFADYIFAYSDSAQLAIMVTDTLLAHTFFNTYPKDSTIQGPPVNDWSKVNKNPLTKQYYYQEYFETIVEMYQK